MDRFSLSRIEALLYDSFCPSLVTYYAPTQADGHHATRILPVSRYVRYFMDRFSLIRIKALLYESFCPSLVTCYSPTQADFDHHTDRASFKMICALFYGHFVLVQYLSRSVLKL